MLATRRLKGLDGVHTNEGAYVFIYLGIYVCEECSQMMIMLKHLRVRVCILTRECTGVIIIVP